MGATADLFEELSWLNALLVEQIVAFRHTVDDPYRGLYVSDADVDAAVASIPLAEPPASFVAVLDEVRAAWHERGAREPVTKLDVVATAAKLNNIERGILLMCIAPEIDVRYGRLYAYLHDDIQKKVPTVGLALRAFCATLEEREQARHALGPRGALVAHGLVHTANGEVPRLDDELSVDHRLTAFVIGHEPTALPIWLELAAPWLPADEHHDATTDKIAARIRENATAPVVHVLGTARRRRLTMSKRIARSLDRRLLVVDARHFGGKDANVASHLRRLRCEMLLRDAVVHWENTAAAAVSAHPWCRLVRAELASGHGVHLIGAATYAALGGAVPEVVVDAREPTVLEREQTWRGALRNSSYREREGALSDLSARFQLDLEQITNAAHLAISSAESEVVIDDLEDACRRSAAPSLDGLAEAVDTPFERSDLVLPSSTAQALDDICIHARHRAVVGERWGFGNAGGAGSLAVLFSGPSGTGKTMSAGVIARELGLSLYRIDLSGIINKYIGETEKNLARVFDACRNTAACLLFDEADALFAKRGEVRDSNDRFANLETSYLLQRIEQHDGLVFLCSNLRHNIDTAFLRRLQFVVHFDAPDPEQRSRLWHRVWPSEVPLANDLDLDFMAERFKLTGGHIKNIAIAAAVSAYAAKRSVSMSDIVRATIREFEKLGRTCSADDFGRYFPGGGRTCAR